VPSWRFVECERVVVKVTEEAAASTIDVRAVVAVKCFFFQNLHSQRSRCQEERRGVVAERLAAAGGVKASVVSWIAVRARESHRAAETAQSVERASTESP